MITKRNERMKQDERCAVMQADSSVKRRGFTYTISMLLLVLLLISVASYTQQWRKSQQASLTELLPTESTRLQERVAAGAAEVLGADAKIERSSSTQTSAKIWTRFPFRKEGASVAPLADYAASLPAALRGSGAEAVLDANSLSGANATVMNLSGSGTLNHSNDGTSDVSIYSHPLGWREATVRLDIFCNKSAERIEPLAAAGAPASGGGVVYYVNYSDSGRVNYSANSSTYLYNNASFSAYYLDGTQLVFTSNFSGTLARNLTTLTYAKSPGAALVLPFDTNASAALLAVRDYSQYASNMSPGGGTAANAPSWGNSDCRSGGCYTFDGVNDFLNGSAINLTESQLALPLDTDRVVNGGFETTSGLPDNGVSNTWSNWTITNPDSYVFDATLTASAGTYAVKISGGTSTGDYLYQNLRILENTLYNLTLHSRGTGSRYAVLNRSNSYYLQNDGSWSSAANYIATGASNSGYSAITRQFSLPLGSTNITIRLYPSENAGTDAYYDSVSLQQSTGMNGGFEYYYSNNIG